jgi:hypothetical protein
MCVCIYIYSERENKIVLVSLRGLQEVGEENKMLESEKYWNNPSIYVLI